MATGVCVTHLEPAEWGHKRLRSFSLGPLANQCPWRTRAQLRKSVKGLSLNTEIKWRVPSVQTYIFQSFHILICHLALGCSKWTRFGRSTKNTLVPFVSCLRHSASSVLTNYDLTILCRRLSTPQKSRQEILGRADTVIAEGHFLSWLWNDSWLWVVLNAKGPSVIVQSRKRLTSIAWE